jgi:hypothetical protein
VGPIATVLRGKAGRITYHVKGVKRDALLTAPPNLEHRTPNAER